EEVVMKQLSLRIALGVAITVVASSGYADTTKTTTKTTTTTTTAATLPPPEGEEQFAERTTKHYPNEFLLSTGTSIFVLSYVPSVIIGAVSPRDADRNLFIPVVGPWIDLGDRGCDTRPCGTHEDLNKAMIITSGVAQGAGVLLAISSLFVPEKTTTI